MSMIDCKGMIVSLLERIDSVREEKLSAGTKYRLMGLVADLYADNPEYIKQVKASSRRTASVNSPCTSPCRWTAREGNGNASS